MKKLLLFCILVAAISASNAFSTDWTTGGPYSGGVGVDLIYLQFDEGNLFFRGTDGVFYYFDMGPVQGEMSSNANAVYSMLLTAYASGKKVSLYYIESGTNYKQFTLVNIHD